MNPPSINYPGPPAHHWWAVGDTVTDSNGVDWYCTVAGKAEVGGTAQFSSEGVAPVGAQSYISPMGPPAQQSGTTAAFFSTSYFNSMIRHFSGSPSAGAEMEYLVYLAPGTYQWDGFMGMASTRGQVTFSLDGATIGLAEYDTYNASTSNLQVTITGIVVPQAGWHVLTMTAATKNASSTGFDIGFSGGVFTKTA